MEQRTDITFEEAVRMLEKDFFSYQEYTIDSLIRIVQEKDPNHPVLQKANENRNTYQSQMLIADRMKSSVDDLGVFADNYSYDSFINEDDNSQLKEYVDLIDIMERKGKKIKPLDDERKQKYIDLLFESAKLKALASLTINKDFNQRGSFEREQLLKEEIKNTFFSDLASASISAYIEMPNKKESKIGSVNYKKYIAEQLQNATEAFKRLVDGKQRTKTYVDNFLSSYADSAVQLEDHIKYIQEKTKAWGKSARDKMSSIANYFQKKKNSFEETANKISENKYEIWKSIKGSFKDNKIKLIGNISASTAFGLVTAGIAAGTIGAPLTAAVGAYAAYHAAGSWVYPIVAEMRKINRLRREKGEKPLKFKEQIVQAWKNKTSKDKGKDTYKTRNTYIVNGIVNTSLAAIGFGCLKNGLEAIDNVRDITTGIKDGVEAVQSTGLNMDLANSIAQTKHAVSMGRIAIPLAGQFADAGITYGISLADPDNKEKAEEAKQTAIAALVGAGFSALAQGIGYAASSHSADISENISQNVEAVNTGASAPETHASSSNFFGKLKNMIGLGSKETEVTAATFTPDTSTVILPTASVTTNLGQDSLSFATDTAKISSDSITVSAVSIEIGAPESEDIVDIKFPDTYSEEMGISQKAYNVLVSTTEGTLKAATGEEITLDNAYANLSDETMANFPNQTREEVLYKFNRLYAFMRKAYEVGDGTLRETPSASRLP